ncbi:MAG: hypothetical protein EAZ57_05820 [Cytophagales bacterium]|nr:MAG: hypothetical protein EAZ67_06725 [Cytophagales bacterium]TAF60869.1 MAG: hypothetical protein EAZ57_05820 [Cytophagales bacterium]
MSDLSYLPCRLSGYPGSYVVTLLIAETHELQPLFEEYGYIGNGYAWEGLLSLLINEQYNSLSESIEFDSEADMLVVYLKTEAEQYKVAEIIRALYQDQYQLRELIKVIDPDTLGC